MLGILETTARLKEVGDVGFLLGTGLDAELSVTGLGSPGLVSAFSGRARLLSKRFWAAMDDCTLAAARFACMS